MTSPVPQSYSPQTSACIKLLLDWPAETTRTYDEIREMLGFGVRPGDEHYGKFQTARRVALRQGVVFETMNRIGIRRPKPNEHLELIYRMKGHVSRRAKTGVRTARALELKRLGPDEEIRACHMIAQLNLIEFATSRKAQNRIGEIVNRGELPTGSDLIRKLVADGKT